MSETVTDSDLQLLARYTCDHAEDAFAEIVRRHLDLVHSAALRQVRSPQLAEEVAQSAFTDLARHATKLQPDTIVTAWLYQVTRHTAIDVVRREARRQIREQIATEMNAMNASGTGVSPVWSDIESLLDEAMSALDDTDRTAVLLRYFENKSLREVGQQLGTSDDAAQKRVSRAVERLREFFSKRGITVGTNGLVVVISANAVQAAPVGLALTISTAAALAGTSLAATATVTATKAIAMTTMQKTLIAATITAAVGTGIYEAHQVSKLKTRVETLQQQQTPLAEQIQQLQSERDEMTNRLAGLHEENERLKQAGGELLRLRGEVGRLRMDAEELAQLKATANDPLVEAALAWKAKEARLKELLAQRPSQRIPELSLLEEGVYLDVAKDSDLDTEEGIKKALSRLRSRAENLFAIKLQPALQQYVRTNHGNAPLDLSELAIHFDPPIDEGILERYEVLNTGTNVVAGWHGGWVVTQRDAVDPERDMRWAISPVGFGPADLKWPGQKAADIPRRRL